MYSSTIKLCQDNKINAKNTWTLNLIDYMANLLKGSDQPSVSVEHNPETDTNFQLAGVTLDAGVKIYCSRVDSVHTNAFKVLGGLSRTGNDEIADDENDEDEPKKRKRKRTGRNTLETNMANITLQKRETDYAVDPLFQKMSAAFDEGGAKGMLMNNLPVGSKGQIIFDSSEPADTFLPLPATSDEKTTYDISSLLPPEPIRDDEDICASFLRYYRAISAKLGNPVPPVPKFTDSTITESSASMDTYTADDTDSGFDYDDSDFQNAGQLSVYPTPEPPSNSTPGDEDEVNLLSAPAQSMRQSLDSNMSIALAAQRGGMDLVEAGAMLQGDSSYEFFDSNALSGWAGPSHWRYRAAETSTGDDKKEKKKRPRGKTAMLLDFYSDTLDVDFEKQFAPGKKETSNQLSENVRNGFSEGKVTLPEDLHYTVRNLASLFLKPKTFVKVRGAWADKADQKRAVVDVDGFYDFDNDCDNENFCPAEGEDFFEAGPRGDDDDLGMELVAEPTRVEPLDINYARVAKRVDVRQLKSGIWSKLCGNSENPPEEQVDDEEPGADKENESEVTVNENDEDDIRCGKSQRLQTIVSDMTSFVPITSISDVSLPYVFICLLHLANEKTLKITQAENGSLKDLIISTGEEENNS